MLRNNTRNGKGGGGILKKSQPSKYRPAQSEVELELELDDLKSDRFNASVNGSNNVDEDFNNHHNRHGNGTGETEDDSGDEYFDSAAGDSNGNGNKRGKKKKQQQHDNNDGDDDSQGSSQTGASSFEIFGISKYTFQAISCSRACFLLTLVLAAVGLGAGIFITLRQAETEDFEREFENLAEEALLIAGEKVLGAFELMAGLTTVVTTNIQSNLQQSTSTNTSSRFTNLPFMEAHFGGIRKSTGSLLVAYVPFVERNELDEWNSFSVREQGWILEEQPSLGASSSSSSSNAQLQPIFPSIWYYEDDDNYCGLTENGNPLIFAHSPEDRQPVSSSSTLLQGPFAPVWQHSPAPIPAITTVINHDMFQHEEFSRGIQFIAEESQGPLFLDVCNLGSWFEISLPEDDIYATIAHPVYDDTIADDSPIMIGVMIEIVPWSTFFQGVLPESSNLPLRLVLESSCRQAVTYELKGKEARLIATTDQHDSNFDDIAISQVFAEFANSPDLIQGRDDSSNNNDNDKAVCFYTTTIYPSDSFEDFYDSKEPLVYGLVVLGVFLITALLFVVFDVLVTRQRNQVMDTARKQSAIVSSLFPKRIQAQMMREVGMSENDNQKLSKMGKAGLKNFLAEGHPDAETNAGSRLAMGGTTAGALGRIDKSKPIADLFPETTIMFADIAGFTAWSSAREPTQVFTLLETIYHAFDTTAKKRRVFKVETIGDCYVAVCGLPDPRKDHATAMAKFALECLRDLNRLTEQLELELGPDTADLKLRVGLHSGPVVAGVLRGEKSRFQLFGDTMNTASRMESTGVPDRVQVSQETADQLDNAGKKHWLEPREEEIVAKGKGSLKTYFLKLGGSRANRGSNGSANGEALRMDGLSNASTHSTMSTGTSDSEGGTSFGTFREADELLEKRNRIADWTVEVLAGLLREIQVRRMAVAAKPSTENVLRKMEGNSSFYEYGETVISEVKEIVELPAFDSAAASKEAHIDVDEIDLSFEVYEELKDYVRTIASMYHDNPFHNFPHANHVTMSVVKLLSRIKAPDLDEVQGTSLHDHTYGITSDPLTRFAVVFSALIHDVDHMGVTNAQLIKEGDPVADLYNNKSVAEQNSIDLAWDLLMEPKFQNLRRQIYRTEDEYKRFRQLVVNAILATDIMDKDLKDLRNNRWSHAFSEKDTNESARLTVNRKATIVIEHLIQASDVAHTMQHWHIYRKWNERLFQEMYKAYDEGRMETDPSENWYKGEMGFFDFYIIPLAKKLKECGVFGVSSDEYLNYALQNRKEWEARGEEVVEEMVKNVRRKSVARQMFRASQSGIDIEGREIVADNMQNLKQDLRRKKSAVKNLEDSIPRTIGHDDEYENDSEFGLKLKG